MAEPRSAPRRQSLLVVGLLLLVAAVLGGLVARMLPLRADAPGPQILAAAATDSLAPLVRKTSAAVVNIATILPSPAEQNPLFQDPFFRRYFGVPDAALEPTLSAGSGVIALVRYCA